MTETISALYRIRPRTQRFLLSGGKDGYRWQVNDPNDDFICATYRKDEATKIAAALNKAKQT